ncbi:MAG: PA0069 family radical SAM protein, partial [Burkholderiaceae bacterium]
STGSAGSTENRASREAADSIEPVTEEPVTALTTAKVFKGRGAVSQPQGRFEQFQRTVDDDGWAPLAFTRSDLGAEHMGAEQPSDQHSKQSPKHLADELNQPVLERVSDRPAPATRFQFQSSTRAISRNDSPDIFFDQSVNPYRGCEHGCVYCYARPGHAYEGLSPGLDFETRIMVRRELPDLLAAELDRRSYQCEPITIGAFTDAYQPADRRFGLTRRIIQVLLARRHPFTIITKNALVERDLDLLTQAASLQLVACFVSVTSLDPALARQWEPRASAPYRRLETIKRLSDAGIPTGVMAAPLVPFVNDVDLERILKAASDAGALSAHYTVLRLPNEVLPVFQDWLMAQFPDRYVRVMNRIRDLRGGQRLNDTGFHSRMRGQGPWADLIANRFKLAARRYGLMTSRPQLNCGLFSPNPDAAQQSLF